MITNATINMSSIDVDKVKKQYDWDPSKGDYVHSPEHPNTVKKSNKFLYLVIAVVIIVGIILYTRYF